LGSPKSGAYENPIDGVIVWRIACILRAGRFLVWENVFYGAKNGKNS